jgi:hypothetical protein
MSVHGTELPIPNVRSSVANGGKADKIWAEEYSAKLLLLGGHLGLTPDDLRRYVALPSNRVTQIVQLNNVTTKVIEEALKQLGATRRWREMSWPERWRWLRTTG